MTNIEKEDRILIVDDTLENLQLLGDFFKQEGYQINIAQNGLQALDVVNAMPPDLILLDIMMPEMDGFETCKRLKADPETADIPVIFLTAKMDTEGIIDGFKLGAVDYLTKPFNMEELLARSNTHLELSRARKTIETQNAELIEAAKLREEIDRIVRHDLKTPLNAIIGYPQIILLKENLTDKGKKHINAIQHAGYRMLNMINLSLDLFKMETGVYQLNPAPVDVLRVLKNIETEVEDIREIKNLTIKTAVVGQPSNPNDTLSIPGEELLCYSMLANLIKNALEASPEGDCISIAVDNKDPTVIRIHNNGEVPEEMRDRFFAKYATFGKTNGTGLGTYSAKLIAETLQGQISMATSSTAGTTVTILLPNIMNPE